MKNIDTRFHQSPLFMIAIFAFLPISLAQAGAYAPAGDIALRHDIQVLADHGLYKGPVTSWPLSWDALAADLKDVDETRHPQEIRIILQRVRSRIEQNTRQREANLKGRIGLAENPTTIRGFEDTPREGAEVMAGMTWLGERLSIDLQVSGVDSPADGEELRADGTEIGLRLGNFVYAVSVTDRWWGPGWDGSLILSNNARPIPSLTIRRNVINPFETKWLSWLGPWDLRIIYGQMENDRVVPKTLFFGSRFVFKPHPSLEIAVSRTAQWCGDGRPCGFDTFLDMFFGRDNVGDSGITPDNEPGNQRAGFDLRWSNDWFDIPMAIYAQMIGEDEAGGFPSFYLSQGGIEFSAWSEKRRWSYRWFGEVSGTSCDVLKKDRFNCAYNHRIYQTGYRYRGRSVGHAADNDALYGSVGLILVTDNSHRFNVLFRSGKLNRAGPPDLKQSVTATALKLDSIDISYSRSIGEAYIDFGIGYEHLEDTATGTNTDDTRLFIRWRNGI